VAAVGALRRRIDVGFDLLRQSARR
jgi:hypothetical protein